MTRNRTPTICCAHEDLFEQSHILLKRPCVVTCLIDFPQLLKDFLSLTRLVFSWNTCMLLGFSLYTLRPLQVTHVIDFLQSCGSTVLICIYNPVAARC